MEILLV